MARYLRLALSHYRTNQHYCYNCSHTKDLMIFMDVVQHWSRQKNGILSSRGYGSWTMWLSKVRLQTTTNQEKSLSLKDLIDLQCSNQYCMFVVFSSSDSSILSSILCNGISPYQTSFFLSIIFIYQCCCPHITKSWTISGSSRV